jgi:DMSO/TMAO reductase YedYZ heme-binding membrane subunit
MDVLAPSAGRRSTTAIASALCALAVVGAGTIIATSVATYPDPTEGWRHAARYTARFSFVIFLAVFLSRPWHQLRPSRTTRWAVLHRRALGLAFATAHFIHLYALSRFRLETRQMPTFGLPLVGGIGAFVLLAAMAVTSNDASVRALGARNWKRLHTVGIYWIWGNFLEFYLIRIVAGRIFFVPFALVALAALSLRVAARVRRHRRLQPAKAGQHTGAVLDEPL